MRGIGEFTGPNTIAVGDTVVGFEHCIIASGSEAATLPFLPEDDRIVDSTGALEVDGIPERLLVIGGGIIGLEMATVYDALGCKVTVVELLDQLIPGADKDLIRVLAKRVEERYEAIHLKTGVESVQATDDGLTVTFGEHTEVFDRILVAVGRKPNGTVIGAEKAGVNVTDRGFIESDPQDAHQRRAHLLDRRRPRRADARPQGHPRGLTRGRSDRRPERRLGRALDPERRLHRPRGRLDRPHRDPGQGRAASPYETASFPWAASGRALSMGRSDGLTKLIVEPETNRILGAGIVGVNAGELLAEVVLAIEAGLDTEDVALTIHPHPTLIETIGFSAEQAEGTITDLMPKRKRTRG